MEQETVSRSTRSQSTSQSMAIPIAIVLGFSMIAAAIYFSGNQAPAPSNEQQATTQDDAEVTPEPGGTINPVTEDDHIRGNPNAPIMLVEYSDFDCPFCKNFHETMKLIMQEYGTTGDVAWVYRHLPLEQLHPSAPFLAEASECVAQLGGNDAFWTFADLVFDERDINEPTNLSRLSEFVAAAGVEQAAYEACLESGDGRPGVEEDFRNAVAIGARGTPYTVVVVGDQQGLINGAQPHNVVKQIIDNLLTQLEEGGPSQEG